jgi:hypothetical protein
LATHLEGLAVERRQAEAELARLRGELAALGGAVMERDLALAIGSDLRPLVPEGPVAQLSSAQASSFGGLRLRRGLAFYRFEEPCGGMREQLAAALRLSMADVRKGGHDGVCHWCSTTPSPTRIPSASTW